MELGNKLKGLVIDMKMYYYMLTMNNEQIFTEVDSENFSETKVKNAIAKKAVKLRNDISE